MSDPNNTSTSVELLSAALRADATDLATYERVLVGSLADALPESVLEIERERSLSDRLAGRPGAVSLIRMFFGDVTLELHGSHGRLVGVVSKVVRNVVISRKEVSFEEWTKVFATELARLSEERSATRTALEQFLGATS